MLPGCYTSIQLLQLLLATFGWVGLLRVVEVLGLNIGPETGCPYTFSWFSFGQIPGQYL
jgi:hypothetical protein